MSAARDNFLNPVKSILSVRNFRHGHFVDFTQHESNARTMARERISTGTPWETKVGYSRAVRVGDHIFVSGTTASNEQGVTIAVGNAAEQTRYILRKIEATLRQLGASMSDVVRTRMYVTNIDDWEQIGNAHAEFFAEIRPAATMVEVSRLINPEHLIEIEVEAIISESTL